VHRDAEPRVERKRSTSGRATSAALRTRIHRCPPSLPPSRCMRTHTQNTTRVTHAYPTSCLSLALAQSRGHNCSASPLLAPPPSPPPPSREASLPRGLSVALASLASLYGRLGRKEAREGRNRARRRSKRAGRTEGRN